MTRTLLLYLLLTSLTLHAQETGKKNTGVFSGLYSAPLYKTITSEHFDKPNWNIEFQTIPNKEEEKLFHTEELKALKNEQKRQSVIYPGTMTRKRANAPLIGVHFKGNELKSWTPTDNSIAISNDGKIVSCVNYGIEYHDKNGNTIVSNLTWNDFVNDTSLNQGKFDPRVIYDPLHDRFILVLLHGFSSATSKILTFFSKSNNPLDGWYMYQLSGNAFNDTSWTDYPTIGISNDELFINGNHFGDAPDYNWHGTHIYQIGLDSGYAGAPLQYGLWKDIFTPDNMDGITLYPASNGQGLSMNEKMYFVQLMPDSGSNVYLYQIDGKLSSPLKTMTASQYAIPHYEVCGDAFQKDPNSGFVDSLSTGSSWTQNAFYLNNVVHFTFDADVYQGWCGIHYGRIYLDSNKATVTSYGESGSDFCYPAVASLGYDSADQSVAIAYLKSDSVETFTPETGVVSVDHFMSWSQSQTVKAGDTSVNILYPPGYPVMPERWGDYTGICRRYTNGIPQAWMAGAYGANTPPRMNSYGTWIAQINSNEASPELPVEQSMLFPNPVRDLFYLDFNNTEEGYVRVDLYNSAGQLVRILFEDFLHESVNRIAFNKLMLSRGAYFVIVSREGQKVLTKKLAVN